MAKSSKERVKKRMTNKAVGGKRPVSGKVIADVLHDLRGLSYLNWMMNGLTHKHKHAEPAMVIARLMLDGALQKARKILGPDLYEQAIDKINAECVNPLESISSGTDGVASVPASGTNDSGRESNQPENAPQSP